MSDYTLADLTRITGAKRRTVQLWAEAGVIQAEPTTDRAGTGTHRRFSRIEAGVACMVSPFALRQMSVGELLKVSDAARRHLKKDSVGREVIDKVIEGSGQAYLTLTTGDKVYEAMIHPIQMPNSSLEFRKFGEMAFKKLPPGAMTTVVRLAAARFNK